MENEFSNKKSNLEDTLKAILKLERNEILEQHRRIPHK